MVVGHEVHPRVAAHQQRQGRGGGFDCKHWSRVQLGSACLLLSLSDVERRDMLSAARLVWPEAEPAPSPPSPSLGPSGA